MTDIPFLPWIHIGECPVCVDGLCRVRTCADPRLGRHFYAMCDECESLWLKPSTDGPRQFPDADHPKCPVCGQDLYGVQAHWSLADELAETEWGVNSIFEIPSSLDEASTEYVLEVSGNERPAADNPIEIDRPERFNPPLSYEENESPSENDSTSDLSYGQDDPKPGC